ncbi:LytTR family DNA-binding domain-containing protein [Tepidicella baoligensis]|uniref:LytTR family DNA-binding domain-containing protein n=1 Tax=Tepidicella baoligensis TaxID=2707016 RepID=UPI0015DB58F1|nr:LytTR family DNA-binding domain-containing protein [Tepidicella baoligensis]
MGQAGVQSPLYVFEKFDAGIVLLNKRREVVGMNDYARSVLPVDRMQPFDRFVLDFHPERSRAKVNFMLDQASGCPVANNLPMTMIINIPEQVLLIKVSRITDASQRLTGYALVFYDVTQIVSQDDPSSHASARRLNRIPTVANQKIAFVNTTDVCCIESDGHYCRVLTPEGWHFCNLSISDLEARLDPEQFVRVHRRFIVRLGAIESLVRDGSKTRIQLHRHPKVAVPVSRTEVTRLRERLGLRGKT